MGDSHFQKVFSSDDVTKLLDNLNKICNEIKESNRTAKLWIQYFELVQIMRLFIRSERTGDWHLHLYAVKQMLPYLHAAGHLHYAKSAHLYLQQMEELSAEIDILFAESGYFTIRRILGCCVVWYYHRTGFNEGN